MRSAIAAAVIVAVLAACDSSTAPTPDPIEWAAEVAGLEGYAEVEGAAEVTSGLTSFEAAIELAGLPAGDYDWELAAGTCEEPGSRVGPASAYEALEADASGEASASATVTAALQSTGAYHVAVFTVDAEDERVDVACGDLERT